jgi:hypothetical protein
MHQTPAAPVVQPTRSPWWLSTASNAHTVVSVLGLALAGLLYLVIPGALAGAAVGVLSPSLAPWWALAMTLGGCMAFVGIAIRRPQIEVVGLGALGAAVCLAAVTVLDVRQTEVAPVAVIYLSSGVSCVVRIWAVVRLQRQVERAAVLARDVCRADRHR